MWNEQAGAGVAVVMMSAGEMIAGAIFVIRRVAMMIRVVGLIVMHDVYGKNAGAFMFMESHESGAMLNLIGRFGRYHRRIE